MTGLPPEDLEGETYRIRSRLSELEFRLERAEDEVRQFLFVFGGAAGMFALAWLGPTPDTMTGLLLNWAWWFAWYAAAKRITRSLFR